MKCSVTQLRRDGKVISLSDSSAPITGRLEMVEHTVRPSSFRRSARVLQVVEKVGSIERPAISLFEPQLVEVAPDSMTFRGIEQKAQGGHLFEHQQVWHVFIHQAGR